VATTVFISHASEDKERFVVGFARRLRENGVDAWLDQWEMQPGDSLVDKIFEQGLKNAQAVIVVISAKSIAKPWVRQELNVSVVKRIDQGIKLIPVVIDQCDIPESLRATIWQRIDDVNSYDAAFERILAAIFDTSSKPALGKRPERFAAAAPQIAGLNRTDELVLREIAWREVDQNNWPVTWEELRADPDLAAIPESEVLDSLEILEQKALLVVDRLMPPIAHARLTLAGFRQYAEQFMPGYSDAMHQVAGLLVNEAVAENQQLATRTGKSLGLINYILDVFDADGHIALEKYGGGLWEVTGISPSLKRSLA